MTSLLFDNNLVTDTTSWHTFTNMLFYTLLL